MQQHRTREDTRQLILQLLEQSPGSLTRTQIARGLARKKTPHLVALIDEMAQEGLIRREVVTFHNGVQGYCYSLNKKAKRGARK